MNIIALGGWMMWPLLAVSILALTVIVERLLLYASCGLPDDGLRAALLKASCNGNMESVAERMTAVPLLQPFAELLTVANPTANQPCTWLASRFLNSWNGGSACSVPLPGWLRSWACWEQ